MEKFQENIPWSEKIKNSWNKLNKISQVWKSVNSILENTNKLTITWSVVENKIDLNNIQEKILEYLEYKWFWKAINVKKVTSWKMNDVYFIDEEYVLKIYKNSDINLFSSEVDLMNKLYLRIKTPKVIDYDSSKSFFPNNVLIMSRIKWSSLAKVWINSEYKQKVNLIQQISIELKKIHLLNNIDSDFYNYFYNYLIQSIWDLDSINLFNKNIIDYLKRFVDRKSVV